MYIQCISSIIYCAYILSRYLRLVEASGAPPMVNSCFSLLRKGAKLVLIGQLTSKMMMLMTILVILDILVVLLILLILLIMVIMTRIAKVSNPH